MAAGYSLGYGGLLRGLDVLAVPVTNVICSQSIVREGGVEGRRVADCGGLVRSIFHGRVLTVSERTSFRDCTTSCINTGISTQVNGVPWLPLALLESLPLPRERVDMPRVGRCYSLL